MGEFYKKHHKFLAYLFWGVATTVVDYGTYFLLTRFADCNYIFSNLCAWIAGVTFAFFVNKTFVFHSKSWKAKVLLLEFEIFVSGRIVSGLVETGVLWFGVSVCHYHDMLVKILAGGLVMTLNYLFSQFFVFRKEKS